MFIQEHAFFRGAVRFGLNLFESLCTIVKKQGVTGIWSVLPPTLSPSCCWVFSSAVATNAYPQVSEQILRFWLFKL